MHITYMRIKSAAKLVFFLHIRKFLVPFLQKTCILPHSMSKNEEAPLPERVRNVVHTYPTRYRAKGYHKHTQRIPQGYNHKIGKYVLYTIYT